MNSNKRKSFVSSAFRRMSIGASLIKKDKVRQKDKANEPKPTNIMLLIMGEDGKRHEIMLVKLQLGDQIMLDLIREVQEKATIRSLRNQGYHCVCNSEAVAFDTYGYVRNYFSGDIGDDLYHLAIPVPYGQTCKDILKMAQPILQDEQVSKMIAKIS